MTREGQILDDVLARLRSMFGKSVLVLQRDEGSATIQVAGDEAAVVGIRVLDPVPPSFAVSYPALKIKRHGRTHVRESGGEGVVFEGIAWIVNQLAQHGVVRPEFE
jgi:hypothetical protein